ncbi:MAG: hypothetical protein QNJ97_14210 [Myxococcota bacterium]|nr:hypothetical protein [Myxococcota bacterium]
MRNTSIIMSQTLIALGMLIACLISNGCKPDPVDCQVARGDAFGKFFPEFDDPDEDNPCENLKGDVFGLHTFYNPTSDDTTDFDRPIFAIRPQTLGQMVDDAADYDVEDEDDDHEIHSLGDFDSSSPSNDVCTVSDLNEAELELDEYIIPGDPDAGVEDETVPAQHVSYEWSNVKVLVTAAWIGTQIVADLKYTDHNADCEAEYKVQLLWPAVPCADNDGDPEDGYCDAEPVENLTTIGSGISPDFKVKCDEDLLYCVLDEVHPNLD